MEEIRTQPSPSDPDRGHQEENQHQLALPNPNSAHQVGKWSTVFSIRDRKKHDRPFLECLLERKVKRKPLDSFLQDTENSVPSREVEEVKKFFRDNPDDIPEGDMSQPHLARAWVDYRRKLTEDRRVHPGWRDPIEVSRFLEERVRQ